MDSHEFFSYIFHIHSPRGSLLDWVAMQFGKHINIPPQE